MENKEWHIGDRVKLLSHSYLEGVSTITEITKGGNIRLDGTTHLYNSDGFMRGGNLWGNSRIVKITEEEFEKYSQLKGLNKKVDKIVQRLQELIRLRRDDELLEYGAIIEDFYKQIIKE